MSMRMNRRAYEGLIREDLEWLSRQPQCPERMHIAAIVQASADHEYGPRGAADRAETGAMRFGNDWSGVFLRGDYAGPMSMYLTEAINMLDEQGADPIFVAQLRDLAATLAGCHEPAKDVQQMKPFEQCVGPRPEMEDP